jgi:hypothetical protein
MWIRRSVISCGCRSPSEGGYAEIGPKAPEATRNSPPAEHWKMLIGARDFYSMSGCRDLLFNVTEHRFAIPEIAAFLNENDLSFLAFEPFDDPTVIEKFHKQFAGAADEANLDQWHRFETDHPETFWDMYVFMVGKNAH